MSILSRAAWLAAALLAASPHLLHAQELAPSTAALQPPPAQAQAPAAQAPPPRPRWHGTLSAGIGLAGGVQSQRGYQLGATVQRPFSDGGSFLANVSRQYQHVTFPSESLLADRFSVSVGADENLTKYSVAMARSMYLKDHLLYVDSRYEELFGYGLHLYDAAKRFDLQLVPGVSFFKEDLVYSPIREWKASGGFFEKFTAKVNAAWSVENSFRIRRNFKDADRSIESLASLNGMITRTLGIQLEYQYNYESIVPPHFPNYLQVLSAGLRFQF